MQKLLAYITVQDQIRTIPIDQHILGLESLNNVINYLTTIGENYSYAQLTSNNNFQKLISTLQADIEREIAPNIIHMYDVVNVNKDVVGQSPSDYGYHKVELFKKGGSSEIIDELSLFVFIPKNEVSITPPHDHHTINSKTYTSPKAFEYSVPVTIDTEKKQVGIDTAKGFRDDLGPHIVFFSTKSLTHKKAIDLINDKLRTCIECYDGYRLTLNQSAAEIS